MPDAILDARDVLFDRARQRLHKKRAFGFVHQTSANSPSNVSMSSASKDRASSLGGGGSGSGSGVGAGAGVGGVLANGSGCASRLARASSEKSCCWRYTLSPPVTAE